MSIRELLVFRCPSLPTRESPSLLTPMDPLTSCSLVQDRSTTELNPVEIVNKLRLIDDLLYSDTQVQRSSHCKIDSDLIQALTRPENAPDP